MFLPKPDDIRVQSLGARPESIFLGIAPSSEVDQFLDDVAHDQIIEWAANRNVLAVEYTPQDGTVSSAPPDRETFWAASVSGSGQQTLDWTIQRGDWTAVIMNTDGSNGVRAELAFGALPQSNWDTLHRTSFAIGLVLLAGGGLLMYLGLRRR